MKIYGATDFEGRKVNLEFTFPYRSPPSVFEVYYSATTAFNNYFASHGSPYTFHLQCGAVFDSTAQQWVTVKKSFRLYPDAQMYFFQVELPESMGPIEEPEDAFPYLAGYRQKPRAMVQPPTHSSSSSSFIRKGKKGPSGGSSPFLVKNSSSPTLDSGCGSPSSRLPIPTWKESEEEEEEGKETVGNNGIIMSEDGGEEKEEEEEEEEIPPRPHHHQGSRRPELASPVFETADNSVTTASPPSLSPRQTNKGVYQSKDTHSHTAPGSGETVGQSDGAPNAVNDKLDTVEKIGEAAANEKSSRHRERVSLSPEVEARLQSWRNRRQSAPPISSSSFSTTGAAAHYSYGHHHPVSRSESPAARLLSSSGARVTSSSISPLQPSWEPGWSSRGSRYARLGISAAERESVLQEEREKFDRRMEMPLDDFRRTLRAESEELKTSLSQLNNNTTTNSMNNNTNNNSNLNHSARRYRSTNISNSFDP